MFAVVATGGTTNAGAIDELDAVADVCAARDLWLHVDGAYGLAALCSAIARERFRGIERADSFGVDPHKWLFAPYDCAALVYRDPALAAARTRPARRLPRRRRPRRVEPERLRLPPVPPRPRPAAVVQPGHVRHRRVHRRGRRGHPHRPRVRRRRSPRRPGFHLLLEPELSVVLFTVDGWTRERLPGVEPRPGPSRAWHSSCRPRGRTRRACGSASSTRKTRARRDLLALLDDLAHLVLCTGFPLRP